MKRRSSALVLTLIFFSTSALAQQHGGGRGAGRGGAGGFRSSGAMRAGFSPARATTRASDTGFNFNHDVNASARSPVFNPPARSMPRPFVTGNNPERHGIISNPNFRGRPSRHWNHGINWEPAPAYWGGGFWGPFALGATTGLILYGSVEDPNTNQTFNSYQVTADSPGAELLANYHLTQTPCGPPDLVVIFGPDTSAICAYPNDLVSPGEYSIDPSTLTLVSS